MRYLLIGAAATMALVGAASAQQQDKGPGDGKAPGAAQQGPGAGKGEQSQQPTPNRAERPGSEAPKGAQREPGKQQQQQKSTQQRQEPKDQPKAAQQQRDGDQQKSTQQRQEPGKDQGKAAQQQRDKDQQKSTQQQQRDQQKSTQQGKDQQKSAQPQGDKQGARVQVSEQQRTSVRERLTKETRVEKTKINVSVNIGTAIPRSVRLHPLPATIISLAPAYRGYSYVLLEDETIVIIEPRTYVIVDVLPAGTQRADRPGRTQLTLSTEQTRFIFTTVPKDRTANVSVRLALGAEVPRDVELLTFPAEVTARIPEVSRYRYVVANGDVIIVDPNDQAVTLVIND